MKIRCEDGIVRNFIIAHCDGEPCDGKSSVSGNWGSSCSECGEIFGFHDTKVLKPQWRKHKCQLKGCN